MARRDRAPDHEPARVHAAAGDDGAAAAAPDCLAGQRSIACDRSWPMSDVRPSSASRRSIFARTARPAPDRQVARGSTTAAVQCAFSSCRPTAASRGFAFDIRKQPVARSDVPARLYGCRRAPPLSVADPRPRRPPRCDSATGTQDPLSRGCDAPDRRRSSRFLRPARLRLRLRDTRPARAAPLPRTAVDGIRLRA